MARGAVSDELGREAAADAAGASLARRSLLTLSGRAWVALRSYNYRLYFAGQLISQTGSWMQRIAQAWLVLDLTGSPAALGVLTVLQFLPITVLSLVAGVVVDRRAKLPLLVAIQVAAAAQALVLAALVLSGSVQLWQVYALAFVLGLVSAFDMPTRQAFAGELVGRDALQSAISLNSSVFNAARIVGPGLGGVVIAAWGVGWAFLLNGLSYVAVLLALVLLRKDQLYPSQRPRQARLLTQLADGVRYAARTPTLGFPLVLLAVIGTFAYNFGVTLPLLARFALDVGSIGFGSMNAAMGVGSLIGALGVAAVVSPSTNGLLRSAGLFSALLLAVALVPWYAATLLLLVGLGLASVTYSTSTNTTLQLGSREEYRGRVLSLYTLLFAGSTPVGGAITGWLASVWGIRTTLALEAAVCLAAVLVGVVYLRTHATRA